MTALGIIAPILAVVALIAAGAFAWPRLEARIVAWVGGERVTR